MSAYKRLDKQLKALTDRSVGFWGAWLLMQRLSHQKDVFIGSSCPAGGWLLHDYSWAILVRSLGFTWNKSTNSSALYWLDSHILLNIAKLNTALVFLHYMMTIVGSIGPNLHWLRWNSRSFCFDKITGHQSPRKLGQGMRWSTKSVVDWSDMDRIGAIIRNDKGHKKCHTRQIFL